MKSFVKLLFCAVIGCLIYNLPVSLDPKAWRLFSIFATTVIALIVRPYPMGAVTLIALCVAVFTKTLDIQTEALSGFKSHIVWLIIMVFFLSRGFIKTHLGTRVAFYFVKWFGRKTITLGYGIALTELIAAPFTPSNTARAGGIVMPIIKSICEALGSTPEAKTERKLGSYLMKLGFQANTITSSIFLTSCAVNPLAQKFALDQGVHITWLNWFTAAIVPGFVALMILPALIFYFYPPQQKNLDNAVELANEKLRELGPFSKKEFYMVSIFLFMLMLWMLEAYTKINATTVAFIGVSLCLITEVLTVDDILKEKEAWHTLIWLSILITMSMYLQEFGVVAWFSKGIAHVVSGVHGMAALVVLSLIYYYSHYLFAGNAAHVSAMYPAFLSVALLSGAPPLLSALLIAFMGSLYSSTTHYGTASAPIYFSQGYVSLSDWWRLGFIISVVNLTIFWVVGFVWWKIIGII